MRPLVLLWGCLLLPGYEALKGPKEVSGFEGDTLSLKCTYGKELRERTKYWCREVGILVSRCSGILFSGEAGQETTKGRVSIRDSPQELSFTVTLRALTLKDAGQYWCGVNKLGPDETFLVSLIVFPGPRCPPSPMPSFQPLATASQQPRARAQAPHVQPPAMTSPGLRPTVTTAKQGKTGAETSPFTGTAPYQPAGTSPHPGTSPNAGTSPHPGTSPNAGTSPHTATSPHAGSSRPAIQLDPTSAEDTSPVPSSRSSKPRMSIPLVRLLAPVLVLLALLLAAGLIAFGSHMLLWRKKVQLATETQRNEKVYLPTLPLGNDCVPAEAVMNLAGPTGLLASPQPSAGPYVETQGLRQTTEEPEVPSQDPEADVVPRPSVLVSEEELRFSEFISL